MPQPPRITVLGSLNMDISVTVPALPGTRATVLGSAGRPAPGKGANGPWPRPGWAPVRWPGAADDAFGGAPVRRWRRWRRYHRGARWPGPVRWP
jgi:hypothetical protein